MKLKTSLCNSTLLKKDLSRFSPLWILLSLFYILCGYLIYQYDSPFTENGDNFYVFGWAAFGFAICSSVTLFGYLDQPKECILMHSLPFRRETLFFTHLVSGILMHLIPTALFFLGMIPRSDVTLFPMFLAIEIQFLFHFSLGIFSMMLTGNRFAGVVIFGLITFLSPILYFSITAIYQPLLKGIELLPHPFLRFCAPFAMVYNFWNQGNWNFIRDWPAYLGDLSLWLAAGVLLLVGSHFLYRIRKLEMAEQFLVFPCLHMIFVGLCSITGGAVLSAFFVMILGRQHFYVLLTAGMVIGYFASVMLLKKSPRIFSRKILLQFAAFAAAVFASVAVVKSDPMELVSYIPPVEEVQQAEISWSYYNPNRYFTSDSHQIRQVQELHEQILESSDSENYRNLTIFYTLKNGKTIHRSYTLPNELVNQAEWFMNQPEAVYGIHSIEDLADQEWTLTLHKNYEYFTLTRHEMQQLLEVTIDDMHSGFFFNNLNHPQDLDLPDYGVELWILGNEGNDDWYFFNIPKTKCPSRDWADKFIQSHKPDSESESDFFNSTRRIIDKKETPF